MEGHEGHAHAGHAGMGLECNGTWNSDRKGTWKGHVYPGIVFILWGSWWAYSTFSLYLWRTARRPYRGQPWYPLGWAGRWLQYLEPALKLLVPPVAVSMELLLDHNMQYRYLYCPPGTKHAGRFAMTHMNNWQHASSYPVFFLSGLVDLAAMYVPLPAGTSQAVLGCAFGVMAFLMGTHEKHEPQDKMVHWLLFVSMSLCTAALFLEMALHQHVLAGAGKALAVLFQGAWLVQIAVVEFEDRPQWSTEYSGGAMFASVAFCLIFVAVLACLLGLYIVLAALKQYGLLPAWTAPPPLPPMAVERREDQALLDGKTYHHISHHHHHYDSAGSADHSDDNETAGHGLMEGTKRHGLGAAGSGNGNGSSVMAPFQIAHARNTTHDSADGYV